MKQNYLIGAVAVVALAFGLWFSTVVAPRQQVPEYAQLYPQARQLSDVQLTDQDGQILDNSWFLDQWTLTFVGYTYCPDVCPTTLAELKTVYPKLQQIESDLPLKVLFVSVDPKRDTIDRLKEYISFFHPEFTAATAEHKQLFPLIRSMGMMYSMSESTETDDYLVDHSASIVIINPEGNVIGRFKPKAVPGEMAISDAEQILADMPIITRS